MMIFFLLIPIDCDEAYSLLRFLFCKNDIHQSRNQMFTIITNLNKLSFLLSPIMYILLVLWLTSHLFTSLVPPKPSYVAICECSKWMQDTVLWWMDHWMLPSIVRPTWCMCTKEKEQKFQFFVTPPCAWLILAHKYWLTKLIRAIWNLTVWICGNLCTSGWNIEEGFWHGYNVLLFKVQILSFRLIFLGY